MKKYSNNGNVFFWVYATLTLISIGLNIFLVIQSFTA